MKTLLIPSIPKRLITGLAASLAVFGLAAITLVPVDAAASDMTDSDMTDPDTATSDASAGESMEGAERDRPSRPLEPTYLPREPEKKSWYNSDYIFGMTRGLANSTIAPGAKAPLFVFTIPLDIVTLPFTVIGGLFG